MARLRDPFEKLIPESNLCRGLSSRSRYYQSLSIGPYQEFTNPRHVTSNTSPDTGVSSQRIQERVRPSKAARIRYEIYLLRASILTMAGSAGVAELLIFHPVCDQFSPIFTSQLTLPGRHNCEETYEQSNKSMHLRFYSYTERLTWRRFPRRQSSKKSFSENTPPPLLPKNSPLSSPVWAMPLAIKWVHRVIFLPSLKIDIFRSSNESTNTAANPSCATT